MSGQSTPLLLASGTFDFPSVSSPIPCVFFSGFLLIVMVLTFLRPLFVLRLLVVCHSWLWGLCVRRAVGEVICPRLDRLATRRLPPAGVRFDSIMSLFMCEVHVCLFYVSRVLVSFVDPGCVHQEMFNCANHLSSVI